MHSEYDTDNRDRILDFLGSVDRRLRRNDALTHLTQGLWGLVSALLLLKLTGLWSSTVLPPLSVGEMTLRLYAALNYSQNSAHVLCLELNGA